MKEKLKRKTGEELNIKDLRILKYSNVTNLLSNAPFHEIVDTIEGIQNNINDKDNDIKYKRCKNIYSKLYHSSIIAKRIKDDNSKYCPSLNEETNAVEEITLLEIELQMLKEEIEEINKKEFGESFQNIKEEIISEAIKKKHGKIKEIKIKRGTQ